MHVFFHQVLKTKIDLFVLQICNVEICIIYFQDEQLWAETDESYLSNKVNCTIHGKLPLKGTYINLDNSYVLALEEIDNKFKVIEEQWDHLERQRWARAPENNKGYFTIKHLESGLYLTANSNCDKLAESKFFFLLMTS